MGPPEPHGNLKPMFLNRSTGRKFLVTVGGALFFAVLYGVTVMDSRFTARQPDNELTATPIQGARLRFTATGYCRGTTTASGVNVRSGIAAADPDLLPVGSVVQIDKLPDRYNGVYTVMDTGPKVHGRHLDIYIWNCDEALELGRRDMVISVLRMDGIPGTAVPPWWTGCSGNARPSCRRRLNGRPRPKAPNSSPDKPLPGGLSGSPARSWSLNWS